MNACIKPGDWAQLPKQVADLAGKTLRETGKAALHKVKSEGQAIAQSVTSGLGDMVGNITDMGGEVTAGLKSAGAIEGSPLVDGTSDAGVENTALQGGSSETSSSLTEFDSLRGRSPGDLGGSWRYDADNGRFAERVSGVTAWPGVECAADTGCDCR